MSDQRLTLRQDAGTRARPYAAGALQALGKVPGLVDVHRGLDPVLESCGRIARQRPWRA